MEGNHLIYSKAAGKVMARYLKKQYTPQEGDRLQKAADRQYQQFLKELPDLGGKKNYQAQSVYDCIALFALYEVLPQKMSLEAFEELVNQIFVPGYKPVAWVNMNWKPVQRIAARIFAHLAKVGKAHEAQWPGNYHMYALPYDPKEGVHFGFTSCPIADFARAHGYTHLMPAMCNPDYPTLAVIKAGLIRTRTCAEDECCDYWILGDQAPQMQEHPLYRDGKGFLRNK